MTNSSSLRGLGFLLFGLLLTVAFLVGGGVSGSTHGFYWTALFCGGFVAGLVLLGPSVYRSASARPRPESSPPEPGAPKTSEADTASHASRRRSEPARKLTPLSLTGTVTPQQKMGFGGILALLMSIPLWMVFFRSDAFSSNTGQHLFLILLGFLLAQFLPLGFGLLAASDRSH